MLVEARKKQDHYEIYKNNRFVCSCDLDELEETLEELKATSLIPTHEWDIRIA